MAEDKILAEGLFFKEKHQNAPEFVIGGLSVKKEEFTKFLHTHADGDWLNLQILKSKAGKPYIVVDTWKPNRDQVPVEADSGDDSNSLPF